MADMIASHTGVTLSLLKFRLTAVPPPGSVSDPCAGSHKPKTGYWITIGPQTAERGAGRDVAAGEHA
jgi:hypothetical protein